METVETAKKESNLERLEQDLEETSKKTDIVKGKLVCLLSNLTSTDNGLINEVPSKPSVKPENRISCLSEGLVHVRCNLGDMLILMDRLEQILK